MISAQAFLPGSAGGAVTQSLAISDPLGHFGGPGVPGSVSWTGDGQRLINPSFETGIAPWIQSQSNTANGSAITLTSPGYQDSTSAALSVTSGNSTALSLISDSTVGLTNDLSQQNIGFNTGTRFRAAVLVQSITGDTGNDRAEVTLTLATSTGGTRTLHYVFAQGSVSPSPSNSTTDGYLRIPGFGTTGQWIIIDRNLSLDSSTVFPDSTSIDSVQSITLSVLSQSLPGPPVIDPHTEYWDLPSLGHWTPGYPVVYDANGNGMYDTGETVIGCSFQYATCNAPPIGQTLSTDPNLKYVDSNHNGIWNCYSSAGSKCASGEAVADDNNIVPNSQVGVYDFGEDTVIYNQSQPLPGTLLMKPLQGHTQALFDQVELYTATNGYDWIRNGGFEAGLTGWDSNSSFTSSTAPRHSGARSVTASVIGGAAEMAQSIDARPQVDQNMILSASANIGLMTGSSASESVNLWIGLDDSIGNPLSLYYYYKTGTGTLPTNRTDTVYLKTNGFGATGQWLNLNTNLLQTIQSFSLSGYIAPYTVEAVVLEASAATAKTTIVSFDDIALGSPVTQIGPAPSYFYAQDALNTTYVYTTPSVPQGAFWLDIPPGQTLLNITSPTGGLLPSGDYATSVSSGIRRITVLDSASFKGPVVGIWRIFATSTNGVSSVYVEDPTLLSSTSSIILASTVNFVSQSKDPFNQPLQNSPANLTLWNGNNVQVGNWSGMTSLQGWWNASSIILPLPNNPASGLGTTSCKQQYNLSIQASGPSSSQSITPPLSIWAYHPTILALGPASPYPGQ